MKPHFVPPTSLGLALALTATLAWPGRAALAAPYGPGLVGLVAQGAGGGDTTLDDANERFAARFTALRTGPVTDFAFASPASKGFGNNEANAFVAELYADNAGKPGTLLGAATQVTFNEGGGRARTAKFAGLPVTAGQVYEVVLRSSPANQVSRDKNFSFGVYNLARPDTPRLDSSDMSTPNPGYGWLRSSDGGATWKEDANKVLAHTMTIAGSKQGWGYAGNSDDLNIFKTATAAQAIAQGFTYRGAGDPGWLALGLRPQNGLANQELKIVFRIARATDLSVVAEKTTGVRFGPTALAKTVAMDFSGTSLKDGEKYVFIAGLADAASATPGDFLFARAYAWSLGPPSLAYDWQGTGGTDLTAQRASRAWYAANMTSLSAAGSKGGTARTVDDQVDLPLLIGATPALAGALMGGQSGAGAPPKPNAATVGRGLKICTAADAPAEVRAAAAAILAASGTNALLTTMDAGKAVATLTTSADLLAAKQGERALNHLVVIGLPTDPLIAAVWQHEARAEPGGLYVFGWGHFKGDIGYVESDRNPFMHSAGIATAPYETEVVTITGSTPAGVALAVDAFLNRGLVNGVVAGPGWTRPQTSLLDREPLLPNFAPPAAILSTAGEASLIGVTPGGEDEFRGVLDDTGVLPQQIWRAKYYVAGAWDGAGVAGAFDAYSAGLHRRAYGNTLWLASFATAAEAAGAAPKIAAAAKLTAAGAVWSGSQPPYANGTYTGDRPSSGGLRLWQQDRNVLMSTLPFAEAYALGGK